MKPFKTLCRSAGVTVDGFADEAALYLIRVLAGDAGGDHVTPWARHALEILKVNEVVAPWSFSIKHPDVFNSVQGDAHCNLEGKKKRLSEFCFSLTVV